ncbi:hypothetical protein ACFLRY_02200 [Bacteroidota bacterium]
MKQKESLKTITYVTIFSIAMGLFEAVVVIYLREIYYPEGFSFPLKMIEPHIAIFEICREAATLLMLLMIGFLAAKRAVIRFAYFLLSFAIWDIFYYVFLKLFIDWPESLLTWDILFLIPITWIGPVIAPVINAITMTVLALIIIDASRKTSDRIISRLSWLLLITGSLITIFGYIQDYGNFIMKEFTFLELFTSSNSNAMLKYAATYVPDSFNWWIFILGEIVIIAGIAIIIKSSCRHLVTSSLRHE